MNKKFRHMLSDRTAFADHEECDFEGAWVTLTLTTGQTITGIAQWSPQDDLVGISRQTRALTADHPPQFATALHYVDPDHIVMVNFAEAGA